MLPVQLDAFYQTGASAIAISVLARSRRRLHRRDDRAAHRLRSRGRGLSRPVRLQPHVLYLHATPMTEPLLFGTTPMCAWRLTEATSDALEVPPSLGWWMVAACLTRYEAWPIVGALVALALIARRRRGAQLAASRPRSGSWRDALGAALFFVVLSRVTGRMVRAAASSSPTSSSRDTRPSSGRSCWRGRAIWAASGSCAWPWRRSRSSPSRPSAGDRARRYSSHWACSAAAALPWSAYLSGHPFRMRYRFR